MPSPKMDIDEIRRAIDELITLRKSLTRQIWTCGEMIQGCAASIHKIALDKQHPTWSGLAPRVKEQVEQMANQWQHRANELNRAKQDMLQQLGRINSYTMPRLQTRLAELETGSLFN